MKTPLLEWVPVLLIIGVALLIFMKACDASPTDHYYEEREWNYPR